MRALRPLVVLTVLLLAWKPAPAGGGEDEDDGLVAQGAGKVDLVHVIVR